MNNKDNVLEYYKMEEAKRIQELLYKYPISEKHIEVLGKFLKLNHFDGYTFKIFLEDVTGLRL